MLAVPEMRFTMNKMVRGAMTALATTGVMVCVPQNSVIAQAPAQDMMITEESFAQPGEVMLLRNPLYRTTEKEAEEGQAEDAQDAVNEMDTLQAEQAVVREKLEGLDEERENRVEEEKRRAEELRKKKLAEAKAKAEAKRRKEIKACCGVGADSRDRRILERIVEAEAGGESVKGRLLVANVVLNRVKNKNFPSTVAGVVFAHSGSRYQFSPISDGRYYTVKVSRDTKRAVEMALNGVDPSQGALYFMERAYADSRNASWFDRALTRLYKYGCHEFFK